MARPAQVEFPGKKRQRMRMRGTKQADEYTQKRLRKNLDRLLEEGEKLLPGMLWTGKLSWGRTDPVTKTLKELSKILAKRHDVAWLSKRMMAKRGDPVGKALAGSLRAAHETDITTVGNYKSPSFGNASYVRRGDAKVAYQAGLQNHNMPKLRMLPWEDHARKGYFFFSWHGGFVCTGPKADIPDGWLESILDKSRFDFTEKDGVWCTKGLDHSLINDEEMAEEGYLLLNFTNGDKVAIGFDDLNSIKGKTSFAHEMALSMLPPNLSTIMKPTAVWLPDGVKEHSSQEQLDRILDAWMGLTLNEGFVANSVKGAVLHHLDEGFIVGQKWFQSANDAVQELNGSKAEKELALELMMSAEGSGLRISAKGEIVERDGAALEIAASSCNDVLSALWDDHGMSGLVSMGLGDAEAEELWKDQSENKRAFGKFLKNLEKQREKTSLVKLFPYRKEELDGPVGLINDLTITGLVEGVGKAEKTALTKTQDIEMEAAAWAWLVSVNRSSGQEWQFSPNARDKGNAWSIAAKDVWQAGNDLINGEKADYKSALKAFISSCGQINDLL
ncbi:MAG: hypothetical protein QGI21_05045 [Candidatus Poseidoniaceae archaeon]|jgi:hypothetical protein|nr:hypothetical protein [Candidatus Poseidoniaceae archaeon]